MEEERSKLRQAESSQKELSLNWLKERDELKKQSADMRSKMDELESAIVVKEKKIKDLVHLFFRTLFMSRTFPELFLPV
jgi:hypothetical protein